MNAVEVAAIIQDCVSEVSSHFVRHECYIIHLKCRWDWIKAACKSMQEHRLSFAPFLDSCQSTRPRRKKVDVSLFRWKRRKAEETREISYFDFFVRTEIEQKLEKIYSSNIWEKSWKKLHLIRIWETFGTYFRFHRREWNREKRYRIFHFACSSQIKMVILMEFSSF